MAVTLYNKSQVDDEILLGFVERADNLLRLKSDVAVKVTQLRENNRGGGVMYDEAPTFTKGRHHDCWVWIRVPAPVSTWNLIDESEIDAVIEEAVEWFEFVVRHEFTHVWQRDNHPEWGKDRFHGRGYSRYRRQNWADRPVEKDCKARQDDIKAKEGTEDGEYVQFLKDYLAHEIRTR